MSKPKQIHVPLDLSRVSSGELLDELLDLHHKIYSEQEKLNFTRAHSYNEKYDQYYGEARRRMDFVIR